MYLIVKSNEGLGCGSLFCTGKGDGRIRKKAEERNKRDENQEEQEGTKCADAAGECWTARRAGG
jgi:hypothetical protein